MARSSAYGQMVQQLPKWVFGGEFGDISNLLNNREQEYEQTRKQEIDNDSERIALEKKQRQADFEEELRRRDIFGGNQGSSPTLRDMYGRVRDTAIEMGNVDYALKMEEELQKMQDAQEKEARQKMLQQRQDEEYEARKARRSNASDSSDDSDIKGTRILINKKTGTPELVRKSEYNEKIAAGYIDPDLLEAIQTMPKDAGNGRPKSGGLFSLPFIEDAPMAMPSPTPLAKGDTARQTPAPGDQVAVITRKRAKAVKGD